MDAVVPEEPRGGWIAYGGDHGLRGEVLDAMGRHLRQARFDLIEVRGRRFSLYGWGGPPRQYDLAAGSLRLPEPLLRVTVWLYEGFPEDALGRREQIEMFMDMLSIFQVGADLSQVGGTLLFDLYTDEARGLPPLCHGEACNDLRRELCEHLGNAPDGRELPAMRPRIEAELATQVAEIPRQWQTLRQVDIDVYENVRVLESLLAATDLPYTHRVPDALYRATYSTIYGANTVSSPGRHHIREEDIHDMLLRALG